MLARHDVGRRKRTCGRTESAPVRKQGKLDTSEKNRGTHDTDSADPIEETQGASQGDMGGKGCKPTDVQENPGDESGKAEGTDMEEQDGRHRKVPVIILLTLALLLACAGGFMLWKSMQPDIDPGATIQQTEGKTTAEIQKELDKIANESRMTISVAPTVQLKDGRARVNVINVEDNKFDQTFALSQDGEDVYTSGIVKCGQKVEWCEADGLSEGTATITVQAVNKKTGKAYGNPQSVEVSVTKGAVD